MSTWERREVQLPTRTLGSAVHPPGRAPQHDPTYRAKASGQQRPGNQIWPKSGAMPQQQLMQWNPNGAHHKEPRRGLIQASTRPTMLRRGACGPPHVFPRGELWESAREGSSHRCAARRNHAPLSGIFHQQSFAYQDCNAHPYL
ncbi:hypothetical protein NDU88_001718 [Pleurodeles waltl]|uniref:Uncharacterized protein n=1 Tax=Pleurodeles waltl TaxID=8319 RepID=A0AAV7RCE7_PLEWA|nr:hypothetical protein NDU88_001718 [Pleurodeles waltl]